MYPTEPFSAAAFMNSPSSCFSVSAVVCGGAEAAGRTGARTIMPAKSAATTTVRNNFMRPPGMAAHILTLDHFGVMDCADCYWTVWGRALLPVGAERSSAAYHGC